LELLDTISILVRGSEWEEWKNGKNYKTCLYGNGNMLFQIMLTEHYSVYLLVTISAVFSLCEVCKFSGMTYNISLSVSLKCTVGNTVSHNAMNLNDLQFPM